MISHCLDPMRHQTILQPFSLPQPAEKTCQWQNMLLLTQRPLTQTTKCQFWTQECQKRISPDASQNTIYLTNSSVGPLSKSGSHPFLTAVFQVNFSNSSKCSTFFTLASVKAAQLQQLPLGASLGVWESWITPDNRQNRIVTGQERNAETLDPPRNTSNPQVLAQRLCPDSSGGHP